MAHSPELAATRAQAQARGGRNRSTAARARKLLPAHLVPVFDQLSTALAGVLAGQLDPRRAAAAASIARAMCAVLQAGEIEERVRRLEAGPRGEEER